MSAKSDDDWLRVSPRHLCPICESDSWCTVAPHGSAVRCKFVESDRPSPGEDGPAWIHVLTEHLRVHMIPPREKSGGKNWSAVHARCVAAISDEQVQQLADSLGVEAIAWRELGVGFDGDNYTFPMFDATGTIVGIKVRTLSGEKRAMPGSKLGVMRRTIPTDADDGVLVITEGESDCAAALSYGYDALGTPGAGQCADSVVAYARDRDVVVISDNDEAGQRGAATIAAKLLDVAKTLRIVTPPTKDLRQWRVEGATREDIDTLIAGAKPVSRGPIADAWAPLKVDLLSTPPPPRKWLFRHPDRDGVPVDDRHGDGMLPLGKVALFASAGGVGKTMAGIEAAVAVITGRRWFGHFDVDKGVTGDVLLVLGEEDPEEVHRRLYSVAQAFELTDAERREVERRLVVLPFAGVHCVVASGSSDAGLRATSFIDDLLRQMAGRQWAFSFFDPMMRFAGIPIDLDNTNATFVVQQFERLAITTGAAVLISHHTSRESRRQGRADPRGATAIEDGVRWVGTLVASDDVVRFLQTKSNYSRPMREQDAVVLLRDRGGRLRVQTPAERAAELDENTTDEDVAAVVEALRQLRGRCRTASAIVKQSGVRKQDGLAAVDIAVARGLILWEPKSAPERKREYLLPGDEGARTPPRTPRNREPGFPGSVDQEPGSVPGTTGTEREPGTGAPSGCRTASPDEGMPDQPGGRRRRGKRDTLGDAPSPREATP